MGTGVPFEMTVDTLSSLLYVRFFGVVNVEARRAALGEARHLISTRNLSRVLTDYREATFRFDSFEAANHFATAMATSPELRQCRVAFVGERSQVNNFLVETLTAARGLHSHRFHDCEAALAWLSEPCVTRRPVAEPRVAHADPLREPMRRRCGKSDGGRDEAV